MMVIRQKSAYNFFYPPFIKKHSTSVWWYFFSIRGRRNKINVGSETLDPDRDITKPTNRTGDGNIEEDALELSDQARNHRYVYGGR